VPVRHRRTIVWRQNQFWLIVDELHGNGEAEAASYIHLHPNLLLENVDASTWRIQGSRAPLLLSAFGQQGHSISIGQTEPLRQGWYSERFGHLQRNTVLALHRKGALPACFGYVISRREGAQVKVVSGAQGHQINIMHERHRYSFGLSGNAIIRFQ
jgi:Heparinase II/III-like protein